MNAAQRLFMENGGLAAIERLLVGFPRLSLCSAFATSARPSMTARNPVITESNGTGKVSTASTGTVSAFRKERVVVMIASPWLTSIATLMARRGVVARSPFTVPTTPSRNVLIGCPNGLAEETESHELEALRVSPYDAEADVWVAYIALATLYLGDYEEALSMYRRAKELNPNYPTGRFNRAATLMELGRLDEARAEAQAGLALNPGFTIRRYRAGAQSDNPAFLKRSERMIENMRKVGLPEE
jgi:hypothetical protein